MANYKLSIAQILKTEGGYVNDLDDAGGETYRGISRTNWPHWSGWQIIDSIKHTPKAMYAHAALNEMVVDFYKINFWDKIEGDLINNQMIAHILVDSAVNEGVKPAIVRAQKITALPQTGIIDELLIQKLNTL